MLKYLERASLSAPLARSLCSGLVMKSLQKSAGSFATYLEKISFPSPGSNRDSSSLSSSTSVFFLRQQSSKEVVHSGSGFGVTCQLLRYLT